jgi:hypothetical protein
MWKCSSKEKNKFRNGTKTEYDPILVDCTAALKENLAKNEAFNKTNHPKNLALLPYDTKASLKLVQN